MEKKITATKALRVLEMFREYNDDIPIGEVVSFFLIAGGEKPDGTGPTQKELMKLGGFGKSSASRYSHGLATVTRQGNPGHDLVQIQTLGQEVSLTLTPKGNNLIQKIQNIIG